MPADNAAKDPFDRWEELLDESKDCPSHDELVELVKNNDPQLSSGHIKECKTCSEIVSLLQAAHAPDGALYAFISMARKKAELAAEKRASSRFSFLRVLSSLGQPRWVNIGLTASLIALACIWGLSYFNSETIRKSAEPEVVFHEDVYQNTSELLHASTEDLGNSRLGPEERQRIAEEVKKKVDEAMEKPTLAQAQKEELTKLHALFQIEMARHSSAGGSMIPARFDTNNEAQAKTAVLAAVGKEVIRKKNSGGAEVEESVGAAGELKSMIDKLDDKLDVKVRDNKIVVKQLEPSRDESESADIVRGITVFANQIDKHEKKDVIYQVGDRTVSITSNASNPNMQRLVRSFAFKP